MLEKVGQFHYAFQKEYLPNLKINMVFAQIPIGESWKVLIRKEPSMPDPI